MVKKDPNRRHRFFQIGFIARGDIAIGIFANGRFLSIGLVSFSSLLGLGVVSLAPVGFGLYGLALISFSWTHGHFFSLLNFTTELSGNFVIAVLVLFGIAMLLKPTRDFLLRGGFTNG